MGDSVRQQINQAMQSAEQRRLSQQIATGKLYCCLTIPHPLAYPTASLTAATTRTC